MAADPRAFVLRHTRLRPVPGAEPLRLHLADEVLPLWRAAQVETRDDDAPLPYWAFAWAGGLAIARFLREHPERAAGRRVFDIASGSGLCALAALDAGAAGAAAADIDPFSWAAIALNARAAGRRVTVVRRDVLDEAPPDADMVLCGDAWYETGLAQRMRPWLLRCRAAGLDVLVGDPGRAYLPTDDLRELASYEVRTTTELEDRAQKTARVFELAEP
ncbi:MAG TPA: 50S ribosomal protein L11 methyltransferase [Acidimicrobiales bacterium]|nr:50S ribosomal protein L11 methyltransferase [Acidimicrobiales bacterium]